MKALTFFLFHTVVQVTVQQFLQWRTDWQDLISSQGLNYHNMKNWNHGRHRLLNGQHVTQTRLKLPKQTATQRFVHIQEQKQKKKHIVCSTKPSVHQPQCVVRDFQVRPGKLSNFHSISLKTIVSLPQIFHLCSSSQWGIFHQMYFFWHFSLVVHLFVMYFSNCKHLKHWHSHQVAEKARRIWAEKSWKIATSSGSSFNLNSEQLLETVFLHLD